MNRWKWISVGTVGSLLALSHIGMIGMLSRSNKFPVVNLPVGEYTSYEVEAGKDGYRVRYNSNDPKVMLTHKEVTRPAGFLGMGKSKSFYTEQYTMDGAKHQFRQETPSSKDITCLKTEGGGESTGKVVGGGIGAAVGQSLTGIPFVGWALSGAATMIGINQGGEIGGQMAKDFAQCDG